MKKLYDLLMSNFLARYIFLLTLIITIWSLFGDLSNKKIYSFSFLLSIFCIFVIPFLLNILFSAWENSLNNNQLEDKVLRDMLFHRTGVDVSLRILNEENEVDTTHTYDLLFRQDMLNYDCEDFCSYRRICGRNTSKHQSGYLVYVESCDYALKFSEIEIRAIDTATKKALAVEPLYSVNKRKVQHAFRIYFPNSLLPGDSFDISYFIKIPGELIILDKEKEVSGISLVRIKKPVKKLIYNMCLSYQPRSVTMFGRKQSHKPQIYDVHEIGGVTVEEYKPNSYLDELFGIDWGENTPYIIRFEEEMPKYQQYIVRYIQ